MTTMSDVKTECVLQLPIINPDTGAPSRSFEFAGKVDRVENGRVIDWKGTKDPQRFIFQKRIGFQVELYAIALEHAGCPITEVEYRLIKTPTIKLCGKDASPKDYEDRCVEWINAQEDGLVAHPFPINPGRLEKAKAWLWECSKRILENRRAKRWLPNENGCFTYERACEYLPLCECVANDGDPHDIMAADYTNDGLRHPELGNDLSAKLDVVTYTSLTMLSLCEVKYFWRYERGLRRKHDDSEALWIGSAMHAGLEGFADGGIEAAHEQIDKWAASNPIIGADQARYQDQQIAKARAMARAAANRWAVEPEKRQEDAKAENVDADTAHGRQLDSVGPTSATPAAPAAYEPEKRQEPVTAHPAQIDAGSGDVRSDDAPEPDGPPAAPVVPLAVARESDERDILLAAIRHMVIGADPKKLIEVAAQCGHKSWAGLSRSLGEMKYEHIREIYGLLKL